MSYESTSLKKYLSCIKFQKPSNLNKNIALKKITLLIVFTLFSMFSSFGQTRKGDFRLEKGSSSHELYVSFDKSVSFDSESYNSIVQVIPEFEAIQREYNLAFHKGILISDEKLNEMEQKAIELTGSGSSVAKLRNIVRITIDNPTNERLLALAEKLEQFDKVEYCSLSSLEPIKPPHDIAPTTPNFEVLNQTYISSNPGVNMTYAWGLGQTGAGINIRDVEYGFNKNHEELDHRNALVAPGMTISTSASTAYTEHGTAVLGIVFADKGTYGISGMAHGADEILLFPEWQQIGYNRINAITQSIASSALGDVILYEMQATGAQGGYGPAEYESLVWDLTKAATDSGIMIIAAAGNGAENLDSAAYASYTARGNSGAIIVGAGDNSITHNRLSYSTYGNRVDVQAWGQGVFASGYGDAQQIGGDFNQYYTNFSGTSSATPLVASCAIVLQSYYHSLTGNYMTPSQMRTLLINTGIAQGTGTSGHIGPIPNMQTAIVQIQNQFLSVDEIGALEFIVYPNPANDKLTIKTKDLSAEAKAEIHNSLGQLVYSAQISGENTIDLSSFSQGLYFVKVIDGNKSETKKIIKK